MEKKLDKKFHPREKLDEYYKIVQLASITKGIRYEGKDSIMYLLLFREIELKKERKYLLARKI